MATAEFPNISPRIGTSSFKLLNSPMQGQIRTRETLLHALAETLTSRGQVAPPGTEKPEAGWMGCAQNVLLNSPIG